MRTNDFYREFENGVRIEYGRGSFDDWCVFVIEPDESKYAPRDIEYFKELLTFADKYGTEQIYNDYVEVYEKTEKEINPEAIKTITHVSSKYEERQEMEELLTILYMAMVAEENKEGTRLGKRIKRLGIHTLLIENKDLRYAVNFMKGMSWRKIDSLCKERGF